MSDVFVVADNILSPLGNTTTANFSKLAGGFSGVKRQEDPELSVTPFYAALFSRQEDFIKEAILPANGAPSFTKFEKLLITSIREALKNSGVDTRDKRTALILSSTKGNIDLIESPAADLKRVALHTSARLVAEYFGFTHPPIVVSTACISGIVGILTGMRLIKADRFDHVIVAGADIISKFVLSGFQSFQAISPGPCKPFDRTRDGINLGEAAGTVILSSRPRPASEAVPASRTGLKSNAGLVSEASPASAIRVLGGSVSNDANHLSAPSRTGRELAGAITKALQDSGLSQKDIGFISAHGTATVYNDEMEAKAITLAGLQDIPVNSLKGYYGHTLGAAGLIESIVSLHSLKENLVLPTRGFEEMGLSVPLNIATRLQGGTLKSCIKTGSGFGGCNAALVLTKE